MKRYTEDSETSLVWDYGASEVRGFTTQDTIGEAWAKAFGGSAVEKRGSNYFLTTPITTVSNPKSIKKRTGTPLTQEQKEALSIRLQKKR